MLTAKQLKKTNHDLVHDSFARELGVSVQELLELAHLGSGEDTGPGEPAQFLQMTKGAMTGLVDLAETRSQAGRVTGFLGPNGAGKSTTMRLLLGLDRPTSGSSTINGRPFAQLTRPLHEVGALLESRAVHPGRSARNHLLAVAATTGIGKPRVDHVLEMVGLSDVADKRVRGFSLGMGQRLGIAGALLADPGILILDEPINGLDPDGIRWVRNP